MLSRLLAVFGFNKGWDTPASSRSDVLVIGDNDHPDDLVAEDGDPPMVICVRFDVPLF